MKAMQAMLVGLAFAMGISLLFDGGRWQQPLGAGLVFASMAEITWLLYTIAENSGMRWEGRARE